MLFGSQKREPFFSHVSSDQSFGDANALRMSQPGAKDATNLGDLGTKSLGFFLITFSPFWAQNYKPGTRLC